MGFCLDDLIQQRQPRGLPLSCPCGRPGGGGTLRRRQQAPISLSSLQILERLNKMCGVGEQMRKKQQRLLKNMDAHKVMLDLLQIPYDKVIGIQCTAALGPASAQPVARLLF